MDFFIIIDLNYVFEALKSLIHGSPDSAESYSWFQLNGNLNSFYLYTFRSKANFPIIIIFCSLKMYQIQIFRRTHDDFPEVKQRRLKPLYKNSTQ